MAKRRQKKQTVVVWTPEAQTNIAEAQRIRNAALGNGAFPQWMSPRRKDKTGRWG